jgi:hypothetical protein
MYFPVYGQGTVLQAMEHFAAGLHRAAVFNKTNKVLTSILTQSGGYSSNHLCSSK